jgi:O-methyltransferase involved in polyketide biosynthesis
MMLASRLIGGPVLEPYLLARHRALDALLTTAIEQGGISQVLELACGLSPRGWRFSQRYGSRLTYIEADLPGMAARKRAALERMGELSEHHRVVDVDALAADGPGSLDALFATLDPTRGVAVITEGLLNYLQQPAVVDLWRRIATGLARFPAGRYYSDLVPGSERSLLVNIGSHALGVFVRGPVGTPFRDAVSVQEALRFAGFSSGALTATQTKLAYVVDARTKPKDQR